MPKRPPSPPEPAAMVAGLERVRTPSAWEDQDEHACLLLFAMLDPRRRGPVPVHKATGRSKSTLTGWRSRWCWAERTARCGPDVDRQAAQLYREMYLQEPGWGREPLDRLSALIRPAAWLMLAVGPPLPPGDLPLDPDTEETEATDPGESADVLTNAQKGRRQGQLKIEEQDRQRVEAANKAHLDALRAKEEQERKAKEAHERTVAYYERTRALLEAATGLLARQVQKAGAEGTAEQLGLKLRDLPKIVEQHRELSELLGVLQPPVTGGPGQAEPTFRVMKARSEGGDVLRAMLDDALELQAILTGLVARRDVALGQTTADPSTGTGELSDERGANGGHAGESDPSANEPDTQAG